MGANAQTTVPTFTAGQVLTAAQMNDSARTGVPVFADTSARDAAFGGTGEKTLAEGQLCYLEDADVVQYYDGSSWATVGPSATAGLELISTTTIGSAVASVTVSGAFSATYDNYKITLSGGAASTTVGLRLQLGATSTGYYSITLQNYYSSGVAANSNQNNGTLFESFGSGTTASLAAHAELGAPNLAKLTTFASWVTNTATAGVGGISAGFLNDTTQYTAFTITPNTGTLTGGEIRVYGYKN